MAFTVRFLLVLVLIGRAARAWSDDEAAPAAAAMAARIDQLLDERMREAGVPPAEPAADAELMRRASIDLNGVIPSGAELSAFLRDESPDKRAKLIDQLLRNPRYAAHLAQVWSKMLLPADAQTDRPAEVAGFTAWLRRRFAENIRYDVIVADLLTTTGSSNRGGAALFYTAAGLKPEDLAAATSRTLLGVQIHCAQCHDHPFDHWRQEDFWSFAAFFARVQQAPGTQPPDVQLVDAVAGEVTLPGASEIVPPKYLGAEPPSEDADVNRRRQLAIWLVSRDNPYFARVAVNRAWSLLFGRGLVHPLDDFGKHNPASHPRLLDELAAYFAESGYDLKAVFRAVALARAYQRSSQWPSEESPPPAELFACMQVKTLSPEQLYDCLVRAVRPAQRSGAASEPGQPPTADVRQQFIARFNMGAPEPTEFVAGIPQVLALMNGALISEATDPGRGGLLLALDAPVFDDAERIEALFLSVLSREPTAAERDKLLPYVLQGDAGDRRKALGDLLWAMLNSPEFILNH